jgi:hypothetical protein
MNNLCLFWTAPLKQSGMGSESIGRDSRIEVGTQAEAIAEFEIKNHEIHIENFETVDEFMRSKFTSSSSTAGCFLRTLRSKSALSTGAQPGQAL